MTSLTPVTGFVLTAAMGVLILSWPSTTSTPTTIGQHLGLLLLLLQELVHVLRERVEQVVDDVGRENLDTHVLGVGLRLLVDLDVEAEHDGVVRRLLQHDARLHDVALVHWADTHVGHGNLAVLEEVEQGLERTQRRGLHADTATRLLHAVEQHGEIGLDLVAEVVLVVVGADHEQAGAGNGALETRRADLDTQRRLDLLVVHVRRLETQLLHRRRRQQRTNVGDDGALDTAQHNLVALAEDTVCDDNVDGHAETLDRLDLENGGLHLGEVHERAHHALLRQLHNELQHVGDTLARVRRRGDEGDVLGHRLVLVVQFGVESLLGEEDLGLLETVLELVLHALGLQRQTLLETVVVDLLPAVKTIDLVEGNDERRLPVAEELHRLERLLLETVHDVDNENGNVAQGRATRSEVGEGLVTGRVDDQKTRDLELESAVGVDNGRLLPDGLDGEVCGTDLLGDTASLALLDVGLSDLVEKLRLSGIDVTENTANGRPEVVLGPGGEGGLVGLLTTLGRLPLALCFLQGPRGGLLVFRLGFGLGVFLFF
ncbi:hypothetical protein VDGD_21613 [Verticillium dahliae]|nr:hypothetical protein VDGD_21613 [Verticillium dahliae]